MTTTRTGTATMDAEAGSPAVNREEPSHALRWEVAGFLGGFGLAMLAGLDGRLVAWIVAALFAGIVLRGTLLGAWLGFVVASVALVAFDVLRAYPPPAEWQGTVGVLSIVGIAGAVLVVPNGLVAWQLLAVLKGDAWFAPRARVTEIVAALLALVG